MSINPNTGTINPLSPRSSLGLLIVGKSSAKLCSAKPEQASFKAKESGIMIRLYLSIHTTTFMAFYFAPLPSQVTLLRFVLIQKTLVTRVINTFGPTIYWGGEND